MLRQTLVYMVAKRLILPILKNVSGVCALSCFQSHTCCNQKSIIIRFPDDTCFLIIVKSFREACIFDRNVKSFLQFAQFNAQSMISNKIYQNLITSPREIKHYD